MTARDAHLNYIPLFLHRKNARRTTHATLVVDGWLGAVFIHQLMEQKQQLGLSIARVVWTWVGGCGWYGRWEVAEKIMAGQVRKKWVIDF